MTGKMKPVCVGRLLVDVPSQAEVSLSGEMIDGFEVETIIEDESAFHARVAAREAAIAVPGSDADSYGKGGMDEAHDFRAPGLVGRTFIFGKYHTHGIENGQLVDVEWVSVEAYAYINGLSISLSMEYANEEDAKVAEMLLSRLQVRGEDEIPAVPGFCVSRAVFAEPLPAHETEHIVLHIGLPNRPELGMTLASLPGGGRSRSLLTRVAESDADASMEEILRVTKLRASKRVIGDLPGEEELERVRELNSAITFGFLWESEGVKNKLLRPFLSLELRSGFSQAAGGKPVDSTLHEEALLALWDAIASSIRLRPHGASPSAKVSRSEPKPDRSKEASTSSIVPDSRGWKGRDRGRGLQMHGCPVQCLSKDELVAPALA